MNNLVMTSFVGWKPVWNWGHLVGSCEWERFRGWQRPRIGGEK